MKIKVRFFLQAIVNAYSSLEPLLQEYVNDDRYNVGLVFPDPKSLYFDFYQEKFQDIKRKLEGDVLCFDFETYDVNQDDPYICFFLCEIGLSSLEKYVGKNRFIVLLQHRPVLIHSSRPDRNEEIYGNEGAQFVDYFFCNDYMANWLKKRYCYPEKILNEGYPKMDTLYRALQSKEQVPEEWQQKILGKKVFLYNWMTILGKRIKEELCFNTYEKYLNFLINYFKDNDKEALIIRTRENIELQVPDYIWNASKKQKFREICQNSKSIILDETESYYPAFQVSDALISSFSSLVTYFFATGKPVLFLHGNRGEYQCECGDWIDLCVGAEDENDVREFITKVFAEKTEGIKNNMFIKNFDGHCSERIKKFLENRLLDFGM